MVMKAKSGLILGMLLLLAGVVMAAPQETILPNGMKVVVVRDARSPVVVSQLWYRVGSVDEVNGHTGLSHLLEHMMFKGTSKMADGEYSRRIAQAGGKENAFTSRDYTVYFAQLSADKLSLLLELEADRMANLQIDEAAFRRELEVVKEERRLRTDDQPAGLLQEALYANAFVANPVRYPVIGWMDDLVHARADDLRQWYRQWYVPNNVTLVIVGDVDPPRVFEQVKHYFAGLPAKALPVRNPQREPLQQGIKRAELSAPSQFNYLSMAWHAPGLRPGADGQAYAYALLEAVLSGDAAARLPSQMERGKALAHAAAADYSMLGRGEALFVITATQARGRQPAELEAAIRQQLRDIVERGVSEQELARARLRLDADEIYQRDSLFAQAMRIGTLESVGFSWRDADRIRQQMQQVTAEQVRQAAASLQDGQLTVVTLLGKGGVNTMAGQLKGDGLVR